MSSKLLPLAAILVVGVTGFWLVGRPRTPHRTPQLSLSQSLVDEPFYVGAQTCGECHSDRFDSFRQTAHHLTSYLPDKGHVRGSFSPPRAVMRTRNPDVWFEMHADATGYHQSAVTRTGDRLERRTERIDLVIGSGKLGQTHLYWQAEQLFELPVSYLTDGDCWVNSPGYLDGTANFDRQIGARCLECHTTYFERVGEPTNGYARDNFVLGISCERCHGPGSDHVTHHRAHPEDQQGRHIVHPRSLEREQLINLCAQCHSGIGESLKPAFSFRPGQRLEDYLALIQDDRPHRIGIHSNNQLPRLRRSRCFKQSKSMTCISCHDPHVFQRGNLAVFSQRCLGCHEPEHCPTAAGLGRLGTTNCIDCHMVKQHLVETTIERSDGILMPLMRDHYVGIYLDETERYLETQRREGRIR